MSLRKVEIAPHVRYVRVEGDYVLMDLKQGIYLGLDVVASRIWQSFSEHGDVNRAVEDLCRDYEVEPDRALADIETWIGKWERKGLVLVRQP